MKKLKDSLFQKFSHLWLRKLRSEVCVCIEAILQRSEVTKTLKPIRRIIMAYVCGDFKSFSDLRAIKKFSLEKGCKGQIEVATIMPNVLRRLSKDVRE